MLDGDNVRNGLNKDLGFTAEDRAENVRRVAEVARLMVECGVVVVVALVSPFRGDRGPPATCRPGGLRRGLRRTRRWRCARARDPKGLYAKAASGELPNLTGVGQDYEEPLSPDLVVAGDGDLQQAVAAVVTAATGAGTQGD